MILVLFLLVIAPFDGLFANDRCAATLQYLGLEISEEVKESSGGEGPSEVIYVLRAAGFGERSGFAQFSLEKDERGAFVDLRLYYGMDSAPGLGKFFIEQIRRKHPDLRIKMSFTMINGRRVLEAVRANPQNPDLSRVPGLNALNENFDLEFIYGRHSEGGLQVVSIDATLYPRTQGRRWLNQSQQLSRPEYRSWIDRGARGTVVESIATLAKP